MIQLITSVVFFLFFISIAEAQNTILIDNYSEAQSTIFIDKKSYPCTERIKMDSYNGRKTLTVRIGKNGAAGMIILSTEIKGGGARIQGNIMIYLEDGTVISCVDRGIFDNADDVATTVYYLTTEEINKMKESNITSIRYSIKCFKCTGTIEEGNFSVNNKDWGEGIYRHNKIDVSTLISELFI